MSSIYLSNWNSYRTEGAHGPGKKWSIMARPRHWEHGDGSVPLLIPDEQDLLDIQRGVITEDVYRGKYLALVAHRIRVQGKPIAPGSLQAKTPTGVTPVGDGDTLLCACGVEKARAGKCHRMWAGGFLALLGWNVYLDQRLLSAEEAKEIVKR